MSCAAGAHNSRAIFHAVRLWAWRDQFPIVDRTERQLSSDVMNKYRNVLHVPEGLQQRKTQIGNGAAKR